MSPDCDGLCTVQVASLNSTNVELKQRELFLELRALSNVLLEGTRPSAAPPIPTDAATGAAATAPPPPSVDALTQGLTSKGGLPWLRVLVPAIAESDAWRDWGAAVTAQRHRQHMMAAVRELAVWAHALPSEAHDAATALALTHLYSLVLATMRHQWRLVWSLPNTNLVTGQTSPPPPEGLWLKVLERMELSEEQQEALLWQLELATREFERLRVAHTNAVAALDEACDAHARAATAAASKQDEAWDAFMSLVCEEPVVAASQLSPPSQEASQSPSQPASRPQQQQQQQQPQQQLQPQQRQQPHAFDDATLEGLVRSLARLGTLIDRGVGLGWLHNLAYHAVCTPEQLARMYAHSWPWMALPLNITTAYINQRQQQQQQQQQQDGEEQP